MGKTLCSVGIDVGTTTTQLIVSDLTVENEAGAFAVPAMEITDRKIRYESPVIFTPLKDALVDKDALRAWVLHQYERAGTNREQVDTGAVIITGETSRKENAAQAVKALSGLAGDFVVATAGPDLESVLAAKGSGAEADSRETGQTVLHMDIGGGTSNLALIRAGKIVKTGCLNVGGRLLKFDAQGVIIYRSPVLRDLTPLQVGDRPTREAVMDLARLLAGALEMAAGMTPETPLLKQLTTEETEPFIVTEPVKLSFSGGVAGCMGQADPFLAFGDLGPELARAILESKLCQNSYRLSPKAIRATVIGAGCHATQLSGSTIFCADVTLPLKSLPVAVFDGQQQESPELPQLIRRALANSDRKELMLAFPGFSNPAYGQVCRFAEAILQGVGEQPAYICLEKDMAKALGQAIRLRANTKSCLCLDRVRIAEGSYLDVGRPVGPAFPVVVKTLTFSNAKECL